MNGSLTKEKKPRTEAQLKATERMRDALQKNQLTPSEKKLRLKAIKDQLNGVGNVEVNDDIDDEPLPELPKEILEQTPKKILKKIAPPVIEKKEKKVVYESGSEQSEEIITIKKKKKPKRKTIIIEESETEDEIEDEVKDEPKTKTRDTKTQKNVKSKFKISTPDPAPVCYFE